MAHVPQRIIRAANRRAQRRLRAVLVEQTYNDPGHRTTRLPDIALADPGDIFVFPAGVGR